MFNMEDFLKAEHGSIVMIGRGFYPNLDSVNNIKWVLCKGGGNDWAIYYGNEKMSDVYIKEQGDKVYNPVLIKLLTGCTDEVLKLYRY